MIGQTNLFDDILEPDERFVIVVQSLEERRDQLIKRTLREYPSLDHSQMESLFSHLKELFSEEEFEENQSAFCITDYTKFNYAADNVYGYGKRHRSNNEWIHTAK